ncbi:MAG: DUF4190 domain-containing protein [Acidimicrobiales bacterium]
MSDLLTDRMVPIDGHGPTPEPASPWAVASLILSILWLGGLGSLAAVVLGIVALLQIRKAKSPKRGTGLATAGIIVGGVGAVGTALLVVGLLVAISQFGDIRIGIPPPSSYGLNIALSPDGTIGYVTEPASNRLLVIDTRTGAIRASIGVGDTPSGLAVSPDGKQVWVVNTGLLGGPSSVTVVATAKHLVLGTVRVGQGAIDVAFSPDGERAYVTNSGLPLSGGSVSVIDTSTLSVVQVLNPTGPSFPKSSGLNPTSVAVSPDGRQVWVSEVNWPGGGSQNDFVYVFDAVSDAQVAKIGVGAGPYFMALSRDGRFAYVADKISCDAREIDALTYQVVDTVDWPSSHGCPFGLAASLQDSVVDTVTGNDHTINEGAPGASFGVVNFTTSTAVVHDDIGIDPITLATSPDGTRVFVVDAARPTVDIVDPTTGLVTSALSLRTPALRKARVGPEAVDRVINNPLSLQSTSETEQ